MKQDKSELGKLIDSSPEEFQSYVDSQNVGTLSSLKLLLENVYTEMKERKNIIMGNKNISSDEKEKAVKGLYAEMLKIEDKCTVIHNHVKKLTESLEAK